jgi:hypothetical protein
LLREGQNLEPSKRRSFVFQKVGKKAIILGLGSVFR